MKMKYARHAAGRNVLFAADVLDVKPANVNKKLNTKVFSIHYNQYDLAIYSNLKRTGILADCNK